jgi:hypothetical protein
VEEEPGLETFLMAISGSASGNRTRISALKGLYVPLVCIGFLLVFRKMCTGCVPAQKCW